MIITFNEEANIERVLRSLDWAKQILVIDSGSTDRTLEILASDSRIRVEHRAFDSFANQCNFGLGFVSTPFVLSMDSDYVISRALADEIGRLDTNDEALSGYRTGFRYCVYGHRLSGTLYPPRVTLYRPERAKYFDFGHGHRVEIDGTVTNLVGAIDHDDRKPLSRWVDSQKRYAVNEVDYLIAADAKSLSRVDKLRKMGWPMVIAVLPYTLLLKRSLFDGWPGWYYAFQRLFAETMIALEVLDRKLNGRG
jgi:glycosyltransferase involved in cell wall biosynthesis